METQNIQKINSKRIRNLVIICGIASCIYPIIIMGYWFDSMNGYDLIKGDSIKLDQYDTNLINEKFAQGYDIVDDKNANIFWNLKITNHFKDYSLFEPVFPNKLKEFMAADNSTSYTSNLSIGVIGYRAWTPYAIEDKNSVIVWVWDDNYHDQSFWTKNENEFLKKVQKMEYGN